MPAGAVPSLCSASQMSCQKRGGRSGEMRRTNLSKPGCLRNPSAVQVVPIVRLFAPTLWMVVSREPDIVEANSLYHELQDACGDEVLWEDRG